MWANPMLVVSLRGTEEEMGRQHGELLREAGRYESVLCYYPRMPEIMLRGTRGALSDRLLLMLARPLMEWALRRMERGRPADIRGRSAAFLRALGRPPAFARYLFVMDLLQNVVGLAGRWALGPFSRRAAAAVPPACSSLAVWGSSSADGALRHARNFDFSGMGIWERTPAVVFCRPAEGVAYGFVTSRGADTPGVTAFNEAGLVISMHTRFHRHVRFDGVGAVDLGHEIIRRAATLDEAIAVARHRPVCSTWGLLISSARERSAVLVETHGRRTSVVRPRAGQAYLACTNRYRDAQMQRGQVTPSPAFVYNSQGRERALVGMAERAAVNGGLTLAALQECLGSHADPDPPHDWRAGGSVLAQPCTVQSVVVEPERRAISASVGDCPTGRGPYIDVPWSWDEAVGWRSLSAPAAPQNKRADGLAVREAAHRHYLDAARLAGIGCAPDAIEAALAQAVALDPEESTYRLLLGGCRLRRMDLQGAGRQFEDGLASESHPFRRGQLLLWACRTARAKGCREEAEAHCQALLALQHPLLADYQAQVRAEERRPLSKRRVGHISVDLLTPELGW